MKIKREVNIARNNKGTTVVFWKGQSHKTFENITSASVKRINEYLGSRYTSINARVMLYPFEMNVWFDADKII